MGRALESHGPHESLELSIVRIRLETAKIRVDNEMQIDTVVGGRPREPNRVAAKPSPPPRIRAPSSSHSSVTSTPPSARFFNQTHTHESPRVLF